VNKPLAWTLACALCLLALEFARGQEEKKSDPAPAAEAEESPMSGLADIFGEGGMNLKAGGQLKMESDPETGELRRLIVTKLVVIESDKINLKCDHLEIDNQKQIMIARGSPVVFSQGQEVSGEAALLTYDLETEKMTLEGPPKPVVRQLQSDGGQLETRANTITVTPSGKGSDVNMHEDVELKLIPAPSAAKKNGAPRDKKPERVTPGNVNRIPATQN
jgi:lipopolysaccharide export system protein LptA